MTDSDGIVWQFTKSLTGGGEYLFAVDTDSVVGWDVNESNDPNEPCTNGNAQYTIKVYRFFIGYNFRNCLFR